MPILSSFCFLQNGFLSSPSLCIISFFGFFAFVLAPVLPLFLLCFVFFWFISAFCSRFSAPFIETQRIASNQSCLCRTVIFYERDYRRETWSTIGSNPLQIFSQLNRDGEDEHGCSTSNDGVSAARDSTSNGNVSAAMDIFFLTPELWKFGNWTRNQLKISFNFAPFGLISIKSLNYNTVYKTVLNFRIVQFSP